jgi:ribosomal protein S18 acetylase RimI-like enzyme
MNIRQAVPVDSLLLSSLCLDVQRLHAEHHPEIFKMPRTEDFAVSFFDGMLVDPSVRIYIAEEGTQALGSTMCKLFERPESVFAYGNRFLQIEHISVQPDAQRRGVATALMNRVEKHAQELGVSRIQLDSWDFNLGAHAFFEGQGFRKFDYRFRKSLQK